MVSERGDRQRPRGLVARQECSRSRGAIASLGTACWPRYSCVQERLPLVVSLRVFKTMHQSLTLQTLFESGLPTAFARLALLRLPL